MPPGSREFRGGASAVGVRRRDRGSAGDRPHGTAKDRALRLLGVRWRSREELRRRLLAAGYQPEEVARALDDLARAGLVEDARFARAVVQDQSRRRMAGDRAIRHSLRASGVSEDVIDTAMRETGDELERATELALRRAVRMSAQPAEVASRRLFGLLTRRGYGPDVARQASVAALRQAGRAAYDDPS
jgi:regulatory protein